jgi:hypothetical protein
LFVGWHPTISVIRAKIKNIFFMIQGSSGSMGVKINQKAHISVSLSTSNSIGL